jgi:hypothetical protein
MQQPDELVRPIKKRPNLRRPSRIPRTPRIEDDPPRPSKTRSQPRRTNANAIALLQLARLDDDTAALPSREHGRVAPIAGSLYPPTQRTLNANVLGVLPLLNGPSRPRPVRRLTMCRRAVAAIETSTARPLGGSWRRDRLIAVIAPLLTERMKPQQPPNRSQRKPPLTIRRREPPLTTREERRMHLPPRRVQVRSDHRDLNVARYQSASRNGSLSRRETHLVCRQRH